ncbi:hypothetical protein DENIS_5008 [Desulfonema ishimotonii]|uniref:Uncharacterized protein n=1 Tax=Desulfonema ishimotonii TaxID=45657 RepID=A0A401G440_9BACT|nr:hypothetical protein [Desulfonema ishimotonii]GBC64008.1 hypothetical protein DENIS_5008 [Desulfonema ishimotonii]
MAVKRYDFNEDDYQYFIRIFPGAKGLAWQSDEGENRRYVKMDIEPPPEDVVNLLGKDLDLCLMRLRSHEKEGPTGSAPAPRISKKNSDKKGNEKNAVPEKPVESASEQKNDSPAVTDTQEKEGLPDGASKKSSDKKKRGKNAVPEKPVESVSEQKSDSPAVTDTQKKEGLPDGASKKSSDKKKRGKNAVPEKPVESVSEQKSDSSAVTDTQEKEGLPDGASKKSSDKKKRGKNAAPEKPVKSVSEQKSDSSAVTDTQEKEGLPDGASAPVTGTSKGRSGKKRRRKKAVAEKPVTSVSDQKNGSQAVTETKSSGGKPADQNASPKKGDIARLFFLILLVGLIALAFFYRFPDNFGSEPGKMPPETAEKIEPATESPGAEANDPEGSQKPDDLLGKCRAYEEKGCRVECEDGNAMDCYRDVLRRFPANVAARNGIRAIEQHYVQQVEAALNQKNGAAFRRGLKILEDINPESPDVQRLKPRVADFGKSSAARPAGGNVAAKQAAAPGKIPDSGRKTAENKPQKTTPPRFDTEALIQESLGAGFNQ